MRCPLMVVIHGAYACASSRPRPTTGTCAAAAASRASGTLTGPKSSAWLLAMVTTSTPPALSAWKAVAGDRKVNSFGCGAPRVVTAVSRLTTPRSAAARTEASGPMAVPGSASRAAS